MEKNKRLTEKYVEEIEGVQTGKVWFMLRDHLLPVSVLLERIGRYEETGLSPEEIEELKHNHEKLQDFEVQNNEQLRKRIAELERENQRLREELEMEDCVEEFVRFLNNDTEDELRETQIRLKEQRKINEMLMRELKNYKECRKGCDVGDSEAKTGSCKCNTLESEKGKIHVKVRWEAD